MGGGSYSNISLDLTQKAISQEWQELTIMMPFSIVLLWPHVAAGAIHSEDRFYTSKKVG